MIGIGDHIIHLGDTFTTHDLVQITQEVLLSKEAILFQS